MIQPEVLYKSSYILITKLKGIIMTIRNTFLLVALFISSAAFAMESTDSTTTTTSSGQAQDDGTASGRN